MALIDDVIAQVNATLTANLSWLDAAYGKVTRLVRSEDRGRVIRFPAIYTGAENSEEDYTDLSPKEELGNYCYWEVYEEMQYESINRNVRPKFRFRLVFWFDWRDLYGDWQSRSIEEVKAQILNVLTAAPHTRSIDMFTVYENMENIFTGYTIYKLDRWYDASELRDQPMMRPFGALAFEGQITAPNYCSLDMQPPTIPANLFGLIPANYSDVEQVWPLETYFGKRIYWRTYFPEGAQFEYVPLDGLELPFAGTIIRSQSFTKNITSNAYGGNTPVEVFYGYPGSETHLSVQIPFESFDFRVTIWYTKE